jgi:Secretion system C-terminal sorting domain
MAIILMLNLLNFWIMKKIFIILIGLLYSNTLLLAQNPYEWIVQEPVVGGRTSDNTNESASTPISFETDQNNNLYMVTAAKVTNKIVQLIVNKYSSTGQLLWHKGFDNKAITGSNTYAYLSTYKITKHPQGYLIYGSFNDTLIADNIILTTNSPTFYAILLNTSGNVVSAKKTWIGDIYVQNNKIFSAVLGYWKEFDNNLSVVRNVFPFNITGSIIKHSFSNNHHTFVGFFNNSQTFGDTTLTALGNSPPNFPYDSFVLRYDTIGQRVWLKHFTGLGNEIISALHTDEQGNIYVVGFNNCYQCNYPSIIDGFTVPTNNNYVIKIAANGTVLWVKTLVGEGFIATSNMYNNSLIIGGEYKNGNSFSTYCNSPVYPDENRPPYDYPGCGYAAAIIRPNANDGWKSGYRMGGNYYDKVQALAPATDGSLYIGFASSSDTIHFDGHPTEFYKQNGTIFIAKMRASAVVDVETIPAEANNPKIDIFPNPSSDFFTIDTPLAYDRIDITNAIGQVFQTEYTTEPKYIYTNTLANGIYFVCIYHKNQRIGTKKMLLQR